MKWQNNRFMITGSSDSLLITPKEKGAVAIGKDRNDGLYMLIRIKRSDGKLHWEFPRGFSEKGESYCQTAVREFSEETGLNNAKNVHLLGTVMPDSGILNVAIGLVEFDADFSAKVKLQKSEGITDCMAVSFKQLAWMVKTGRITDGFTISSICQVLVNKEKQYER